MPSPQTAPPQVLVVGAGPAGLASAYYLKRAGIPFKVLERTQEIAHTWNNLYPSLRLNTTKWYSHMPDMPMPWHYPVFPTAKQYHRHLVDFAQRMELIDSIHFGVEVQQATPQADGTWHVETSEGVEDVPALISATGRFDHPISPDIPGLADFAGQVVHAHDYFGPDAYAGQRVMVIGNGPSGVDIAPELGSTPGMPPVLLAMRTGVILRPRYPFGLPKHAWMIIGDWLPDAIGKPLVKAIGDIKFENLAEIGIRVPAPDQESTAAGTRGDELIRAVKAGQVICVPGPRKIYGRCVELDDGTVHEVDTLILATGYRVVLHHYINAPMPALDRYGWPARDQSTYTPTNEEGPGYPSDSGREVEGLPGLYLVGVFYQGKGALYNINMEARIAVEQIQERLARLGDAQPSEAGAAP